MTSKHNLSQNPTQDVPPEESSNPEASWPPLIYHARVPLYIKLRDLLITLAGWLLIVDLLEDIWVLITQWLHLAVFKRKVEVDHLMLTLWGNIHEFFYLSMTFVAVVVLAGVSRRNLLRRPIEGHDLSNVVREHPVDQTFVASSPASRPTSRLVFASVDSAGDVHLRHNTLAQDT